MQLIAAIISVIVSICNTKGDIIVFENIQDVFSEATRITVTYDGSPVEFLAGEGDYYKIMRAFAQMVENAHQMPALGVALDGETKNHRNYGVWAEFHFERTRKNLDMPFDSLLMEVNPDYLGFNVVRGLSGVYEGRCYYLDLDSNGAGMTDFYNQLIQLKW